MLMNKSPLSGCPFITTIAVNDLENGTMFYETILGLKKVGENSAGVQFECSGGMIGIHQSATAGSSLATCAWWTVDNVEATVKTLRSRGVEFMKNYDLPYAQRENDIYFLNKRTKAAWFKDLDGNILGIGNF